MTARRIAIFFATSAIAVTLLLSLIFFTFPAHAQSHPADQVYLLSAGSITSGQTHFATDLFVTNATGDSVDVTIVFVGVDSPWRTILPNRIHLGPYERGKELIDPLPSFGINGTGMLIFNPCLAGADCAPVLDQSRTANPTKAPHYIEHSSNFREISVEARIYSHTIPSGLTGVFGGSGTYGEAYPGLPWYMSAWSGGAAAGMDRPFITGVRADTRWKTKVTMVNASEFSFTEIVATLYDGTGRARGTFGKSFGPLGNSPPIPVETMFPVLIEARMNRQPPIVNPWITFEQVAVVPTADAARYGCVDGCPGFFVQGTMIDTLSGDATLLEGQYEAPDRTLQTLEKSSNVRAASLLTAALTTPPAARIADVLHATFKGLRCTIEPSARGGYLVRKPDGAPWVDIGIDEYVKVREMCGATASGSAQ